MLSLVGQSNSSYNEQALASTQLTRNQIIKHGASLKEILPKVEVVMEIGVESIAHGRAYVQRIAAISLDNTSSDGKLKVNISFYKQEDLLAPVPLLSEYEESSSLLALPAPEKSEESFRALVSKAAGSEIIMPPPIPLINDDSIGYMHKMKAPKRCPTALKILNFLKDNTFRDGITLPWQETIIHSHIELMTRDLKGNIERLTSYEGHEGYHAGLYLSTGVQSSSDSSEDLESRFNQFVEVAKGVSLPRSIDPDSERVTVSSLAYKGDPQLLKG